MSLILNKINSFAVDIEIWPAICLNPFPKLLYASLKKINL